MVDRKPRSWPSITGDEKDRASEALRRLEDMTRLISDWVFETDRDGVITYVSERIIDKLGLHPAQVEGQRLGSIGHFIDSIGLEIDCPDMTRPFRDASFSASDTGGKKHYFAISCVPRFSDHDSSFMGTNGIAKDVTEVALLEKSNTQLSDAIDVLSGYFALYDEDDRLLISNARFREQNRKYGPFVEPGSRYEDLLRAQVDAGRFEDAIGNEAAWIEQRLAQRKSGKEAYELPLSDGRWLLVDEQRLSDQSTVMASRDITELKRIVKALEESAERHREFAANVAHKLRTPLAVLRSNLDSIGDTPVVDALKRDVDVLARLVEQLLTLTRYNQFILSRDSVADLKAVVTDVIASLAPRAIKEGRNIELHAVDGKLIVHGDEGALEHMVRNLLENAMKYSARGMPIKVRLENDPVVLQIIDQGRGIPHELRGKLFEQFVRSDRRSAGAGLGLSIVKSIADAHGAEISAGDATGGGSVFTLTFPSDSRQWAKVVKL